LWDDSSLPYFRRQSSSFESIEAFAPTRNKARTRLRTMKTFAIVLISLFPLAARSVGQRDSNRLNPRTARGLGPSKGAGL
jgi:hypothetical protein